MSRPLALDLFCGAGGASMGLHRAGFDVVGVDINIKRAKRYPFRFIHGDALRPPVNLASFSFIWASPPCQAYTEALNHAPRTKSQHPGLVGVVREMLTVSCVPFVMENVRRAPLRPDVVLTGAQFGLGIVRRRHFEVHGIRAPFALMTHHLGKTVGNGTLAGVVGHGTNLTGSQRLMGGWKRLPQALKQRIRERNSLAGWSAAMGIDWMTRDELRESVPPAYAEFIGRAALEALA